MAYELTELMYQLLHYISLILFLIYLSNFDDTILARHKEVMTEIYKEFGNHASIIMWSLANEPMSNKNESDIYFE